MEAEGVVDIYNFVQQMRYKRNYMVQTSVRREGGVGEGREEGEGGGGGVTCQCGREVCVSGAG